MTASSRNVRTWIGPTSLVAGPLLMTLGDLIHPKEKAVAAEQVAIVLDHASRWYAAHLLLFIGMLLFVPGILAITALAAERKPAVGQAARSLMMISVAAFSAVFFFEMLLGRFVSDGASAANASAVLDTFQSGWVFGALAPAALAFFVGVGLLVFALAGKPGPFRWPAVVLGLGALFILAEIASSQVLLSQIGNVLTLVSTATFAWLIVRGPQAGVSP